MPSRYEYTAAAHWLIRMIIFACIGCGGFLSSCGKEQSIDIRPTVMRMYDQRWWLKTGTMTFDGSYTDWGDPHAEVIQTPDSNIYPVADTIYSVKGTVNFRLTYFYYKL